MGRFDNKIVVISAGAQPLGAGIATRFAQEGAKVMLLDEDTDSGRKFAATIGATFVAAKLSDKASLTRAIEGIGKAHGRLDAMVLGAEDIPSADHFKPLEEKTDADFKQALDRDVWGALWLSKAAFPFMKTNGASLIFMFSPFGQFASRNIGDDITGHWGALGLSRNIANEWGRYQIRANVLIPLANTPGFQAYRARGEQLVDWRLSKTPMKRTGDPVRDIGGAALFLASDDTRYVTGQWVYADGGSFLCAPVAEAHWDI